MYVEGLVQVSCASRRPRGILAIRCIVPDSHKLRAAGRQPAYVTLAPAEPESAAPLWDNPRLGFRWNLHFTLNHFNLSAGQREV